GQHGCTSVAAPREPTRRKQPVFPVCNCSGANFPHTRRATEDLRPGGHRARHDLAIDQDGVDFLIKEREQPGDLPAFIDWGGIVPDEVAERLAADGDAVVGGNALVGTLGWGLGRAENVGPYIVTRDVVAGRQTRLEQKHGTPRGGYRRAADDHLDTA